MTENDKDVAIILAGFGHVGRAFARIAAEKAAPLRSRYGLRLRLVAIVRKSGILYSQGGLDGASLAAEAEEPTARPGAWAKGTTLTDVLGKGRPGVLVDCTPSSIRSGEPGLGIIREALAKGWNVATAGKGPLVRDYTGLKEAARRAGVEIRYSAATAAALPTLDVGVMSLAGAEVLKIEGVLNGTSNYILTRMEEGLSYGRAVEEAQAKGIAEPDPSLDVGGWDTACKLVLIANAVLETAFDLGEVRVDGIGPESETVIRAVAGQGRTVKLLGSCSKAEAGSGWTLRVGPAVLEPEHPLFGVRDTSKGITFTTDTMGAVTVSGGKSDPRGAAAALLKDIIHIHIARGAGVKRPYAGSIRHSIS
jgi:homoserine dehydrogenase